MKLLSTKVRELTQVVYSTRIDAEVLKGRCDRQRVQIQELQETVALLTAHLGLRTEAVEKDYATVRLVARKP